MSIPDFNKLFQSEVKKEVRDFFVNYAKKKLMAQIIKVKIIGSLMAFPIIGPLIGFAIHRLVTFVVDKLVLGAAIGLIRIDTSMKLRAFKKEKEDLLEKMESGIETEEDIEKFDKAAFDLIRLNM
jgi:pilus assembly protein TadC